MWIVQRFWKPSPDGELTGTELHLTLKAEGIKDVFITDTKYSIASEHDIRNLLSMDVFKFREYVPDKYDCDNYAFSFMGTATNLLSGYAIGIIFVRTPNGNHALNFFVDKNSKIRYIEPQKMQIISGKNYEPYFVLI